MNNPKSLTKRLLESEGAAAAAVSLLLAFVYFGTYRFGYVCDDIMFILHNGALEDIGNAFAVFANSDTFGTGLQNPYYRPVTTLSFLLNASIFGKSPASFHVVNVLLHLGASLALWAILKKKFKPAVALLGTLLFALHPANVEPVSYISARADVMAGLFAALCYIFYDRYRSAPSWRSLTLATFFFLLGVFSKVTATMIIVVIAAELFADGGLRRHWKSLIPLALVPIVYIVSRFFAVALYRWYDTNLWDRLPTAGITIATDILNAFFPLIHNVHYDTSLLPTLGNADAIGGWLLTLLFCCAGYLLFKADRRGGYGVLWFIATLFPASGIVALIYPTFVADRYLYLPLMGSSMAVCAILELTVSSGAWPKYRAAIVSLLCLWVAGFGVNSRLRTNAWESNLVFWEKAFEHAPTRPAVLAGLGTAKYDAGQFAHAESIFAFSLKINGPDPSVYANYGLVCAGLGRFQEAVDLLEKAIQMDPSDWNHFSKLGSVMLQIGEEEKAIANFKKAVELNPHAVGINEFLENQKRADRKKRQDG